MEHGECLTPGFPLSPALAMWQLLLASMRTQVPLLGDGRRILLNLTLFSMRAATHGVGEVQIFYQCLLWVSMKKMAVSVMMSAPRPYAYGEPCQKSHFHFPIFCIFLLPFRPFPFHIPSLLCSTTIASLCLGSSHTHTILLHLFIFHPLQVPDLLSMLHLIFLLSHSSACNPLPSNKSDLFFCVFYLYYSPLRVIFLRKFLLFYCFF